MAPLLFACVFTSCDQPKISSYEAPKEQPTPVRNPVAREPTTASTGGGPTWTAPKDWKELPLSSMRKGSYGISGKGNTKGDMSISSLTGDSSMDLANINRWRGQLQLAPVSEITPQVASMEKFSNGDFLVMDFVSQEKPEGKDYPQRMLAAILHWEGQIWFFKLTGDDPLVKSQKSVFMTFLKSVKFGGAQERKPQGVATAPYEPAASVSEAHATKASETPPLEWDMPKGWVQQPNTPMRIGSFLVSETGGRKADISIIELHGDGGGFNGNMLMWMEQLAMAPVAEKDYAKYVQPFKMTLGEAKLVELVSEKKVLDNKFKGRMMIAILPHGEHTWFFKIVGEDQLVLAQKKVFLEFLKSVKAMGKGP